VGAAVLPDADVAAVEEPLELTVIVVDSATVMVALVEPLTVTGGTTVMTGGGGTTVHHRPLSLTVRPRRCRRNDATGLETVVAAAG
jgi:hypothetical protein